MTVGWREVARPDCFVQISRAMNPDSTPPDRWHFIAFVLWSGAVMTAFLIVNLDYLLEKLAARWPGL